ncbi:MAG: hypothetical protein HY720_03065, partial [Planctomycetes bacterium]|nr:hypothetical protein [Planctomycetota bacterium]
MDLRARDVWVAGRRGLPALAEIELALVPGCALGVAGGEVRARRSLLAALAGTLPIARGEILLDGRPASEDPLGWRSSVGLSLPRAPRASNFAVDSYLRATGEIFGLSPREAVHRASELLDLLALSSRARVPLIRLAAPESTRLELARVLVPDPEVILLDGAVPGFEGDIEAFRRILDFLLGAGKALLLAAEDAAPLHDLGVPVRLLAGARLLPGDGVR